MARTQRKGRFGGGVPKRVKRKLGIWRTRRR